MATTPERLARLEARADELERRLSGLADEVHGGPSVDFTHSVRGRLHAMQSAMASADKVREAAEAAARAQSAAAHTLELTRGRRFSKLAQTILVACGVVTAACAVIGAGVALFG